MTTPHPLPASDERAAVLKAVIGMSHDYDDKRLIITPRMGATGTVQAQLVDFIMAAIEPALAAKEARIAELEEALRFYADGTHFALSDKNAWDTVSGEPQNWWCDEEGTATIEDGTLAAMALKGTPLPDEDGDQVAATTPGNERAAVGDWRTPTTVAQRLGDVMQLLCGKRPPEEMVAGWLDNTSEELQEFAINHGPAWAQGIGLIDAAMVMVDQPTEITTIDNPDRDHEHRATPPAAPEALEGDAATQALRKVLTAVQKYLPPDGPSAHDTLTEIIGLVDPWPLDAARNKGEDHG